MNKTLQRAGAILLAGVPSIALLSGASAHELPWGAIMAASVTVTVPLLVLALTAQRHIVAGLTAGAVRG